MRTSVVGSARDESRGSWFAGSGDGVHPAVRKRHVKRDAGHVGGMLRSERMLDGVGRGS